MNASTPKSTLGSYPAEFGTIAGEARRRKDTETEALVDLACGRSSAALTWHGQKIANQAAATAMCRRILGGYVKPWMPLGQDGRNAVEVSS